MAFLMSFIGAEQKGGEANFLLRGRAIYDQHGPSRTGRAELAIVGGNPPSNAEHMQKRAQLLLLFFFFKESLVDIYLCGNFFASICSEKANPRILYSCDILMRQNVL